jgi:hypothetical protein
MGTFLRPGMTVESSMKRRLIFSRRFLSAMTCSCTHGSGEDVCPVSVLAVLFKERFLDAGDLCAG